MAQLQWNMVLGQERVKDFFSSAFTNGTIGHAYLLSGEAGTGTFTAALEISMALLCSSETARPCYTCSSCRRVRSYSHPDFHVVMPFALKKEHKTTDNKITEAGWEAFAAGVRERMEDPYLVPEFSTPPSIPVDWIRELTHSIRRGAVEKGKNIVILDGIDVMLKESANTLLKTLEEPPPDTLLLLCTDRPHVVLPTIVSRCQLLRFAALPPDTIRLELVSRLSLSPDDPRLDAVAHVGSLGRAQSLLRHIDASARQDAREFWRLIIEQDHLALFDKIDEISASADYGRHENLFMQLMYGIRNAFFTKMNGTENYIMGGSALSGVVEQVISPHAMGVLAQHCETAIGRIRARTNIALVLINFALSVMEFYNEQKQQGH
ncbi:MAG: hypothetical protein JXA18_14785 [Chitinispirillaceae bacterium]|nr:hypothetical protein [Chitinispirillaceae bacterium]